MKVSGVNILIPFTFSARKATAMRPVLWRVHANSSVGFPNPTTIYILLLCQIKLKNTISANGSRKERKFLERALQTNPSLTHHRRPLPSLRGTTIHRGWALHVSHLQGPRLPHHRRVDVPIQNSRARLGARFHPAEGFRQVLYQTRHRPAQ